MKVINPDVLKAIRIAWIFTGLVGFTMIASSFLDPMYLKFLPICPSKGLQGECLFCGMTRAFMKISEFNFDAAYSFNRGSIALYCLMLLNAFFTIITLKKSIHLINN